MINYYYLDHKHKGKRLFKHDTALHTVVQIVVNSGEKKRGRPDMVGVYQIQENTLVGNYLWDYKRTNPYNIHVTTKKLFDFHAKKILNELIK